VFIYQVVKNNLVYRIMSKETFLTISIATGDKVEPNRSMVDMSYVYPPASFLDMIWDSGKYTSDMILHRCSTARRDANVNIERLEVDKVELIKFRCKEEQKLNTLMGELQEAIVKYNIKHSKQMTRNTTISIIQENLKRVLRSIETYNKSISQQETRISFWENAKNVFQEYIHTCVSAIEVEKLSNISRKINALSLTQTINKYSDSLQIVIDEMAKNLDKMAHPDVLANEQASRNGISVSNDKVDESFNEMIQGLFNEEEQVPLAIPVGKKNQVKMNIL
jgi:hypothetical protein